MSQPPQDPHNGESTPETASGSDSTWTAPDSPWASPGSGGSAGQEDQWSGQSGGAPEQQPGQWGQPTYGAPDGQANPWGEGPVGGSWGAQSGQYGAQGTGGYGQFGSAPGGPSPYLAAPQVGIVPLRPLSLGEIYDGSIKAIRANPGVMFGVTAVVVLALSLVQFFTVERLLDSLMQSQTAASTPDEVFSAFGEMLAPSGIFSVFSFIATTVLSGLLTFAVAQAVIGRKPSIGQTWQNLRGQVFRLIGAAIVVSLIIAVSVLPGALVIFLGVITESVGLIVVLGLLGALMIVVGVLAATTVTLLATPALVLERTGVFTAVRRAFTLGRRHFWRLLGIYLLTSILVGVIAGAVGFVGGFGSIFAGTSNAVLAITSTLTNTIASLVTTPFLAAVVALLYIDVRMRTEGLDVELAAASQQD